MEVEMQYYNKIQKIDLNGAIYSGVVYDSPIIKIGKMGPLKANKGMSGNEEENLERATRRAKMKVKDYVRTNVDLNNFVTYTLDPQKIDRYNEKEIYRRIRNWLSHQVQREKLKYVLVPEEHRDGAWHFHGFMNLSLEWNYGFCRIREIDRQNDLNNAIRYTIDYMKKDMIKFNGRRYLHSKNLIEPIKLYDNVDFSKEDGYCVELKDLGAQMKIQRG